jgi:hypothetical protein
METIKRKVVVAVQLIDPVTGLAVADGILPTIAGLPPPKATASNRFVWRDDGPPQPRQVDVALKIKNPQFGPPSAPLQFNVPANDGTTPPAALLRQATLSTTALYQPPTGAMAVIGTLHEGGGSSTPIADAEITIEISHSGGTGQHQSSHVAISDSNGDFTAILTGLTDESPDPEPGAPGAIAGWLRIRTAAGTKLRSIDPPLRPGRTTTLRAPLKWEPDPP